MTTKKPYLEGMKLKVLVLKHMQHSECARVHVCAWSLKQNWVQLRTLL